jgi:UDP-N-acetylmuramyl pentapeptide synthase
MALVNNVGSAHLKGFGSIEGVVKAKSEIYSGLSKRWYCYHKMRKINLQMTINNSVKLYKNTDIWFN